MVENMLAKWPYAIVVADEGLCAIIVTYDKLEALRKRVDNLSEDLVKMDA
jgi:hypothetical protein